MLHTPVVRLYVGVCIHFVLTHVAFGIAVCLCYPLLIVRFESRVRVGLRQERGGETTFLLSDDRAELLAHDTSLLYTAVDW